MNSGQKPAAARSKKQPPMEELEIGSAVYKTRLTEKYRNHKPWIRPDDRKVLAVIPGTIQKIMISKGEQVAAGDPLLILEAMKMRNEVTAARAGKIKKVCVNPGDLVAKDQVLVEFTR
jgi:biotin carboxyl carrier protein